MSTDKNHGHPAIPEDNTPDSENHEDLQSVELEIARHQRSFWRFFENLRIGIQKMLIWGAFFLILYLLRDFFTLIFLTFVFSFVAASLARALGSRFPGLSWKKRVCSVFIGFILTWSAIAWVMVPRVKVGTYQLKETITGFPQKWNEEIDPWLHENASFYRRLVYDAETDEEKYGADGESSDNKEDGTEKPPETTENAQEDRGRKQLFEVEEIKGYIESTRTRLFADAPGIITGILTFFTTFLSLFFLSNLFSFLIVFDLDTLRREVQKLEKTKLQDFYKETVRNIVRFGAVVGKVLEAQAVIALVNTALTAIGLWIMGVPNVAFLSLGVFICGFIPVAGVFISSVPICLVGLYDGGVSTFFVLIGFITAIHFLEAYVLNPRIMGAALHINPVLVLIILVIGHHALGVWGLLLGVPICYYFFSQVIKREDPRIGLRAKRRKDPKPGQEPA